MFWIVFKIENTLFLVCTMWGTQTCLIFLFVPYVVRCLEVCELFDRDFTPLQGIKLTGVWFGINLNWIFIYLVVCFCHKKGPDAVWSVPLWRHYCCTSIGLWWSIGIAWCFCIDYRNVSRWMELESSPRVILFLFSRENWSAAERPNTPFFFSFFAWICW